ncbi:hypothetical protein J2853_006182 [Streptosporangium lutulentum]|uniref:Uncharacterized protein n=1 Tax=Streptosporangium lutulentum TaxID=1461250 RepID=A0ABT9QJP6_9ACTN|nr:hypothetical protein [Streptosporangium lutulentum]MDP9846971.1 hypothetical protein [Streptosporangium lutulentum]
MKQPTNQRHIPGQPPAPLLGRLPIFGPVDDEGLGFRYSGVAT